MLVAHRLVRGRALRDQTFLQPVQCRRDSRVLIAQTLHELDNKCRGEGCAIRGAADQCVGFGAMAVDAQKSICQGIRLLARGPAAHDACRGASQILHEHDPQRDRHRPKLADGQRLNALIGAHETAQGFRIESTVGVGNECPGHAEYARIPV